MYRAPGSLSISLSSRASPGLSSTSSSRVNDCPNSPRDRAMSGLSVWVKSTVPWQSTLSDHRSGPEALSERQRGLGGGYELAGAPARRQGRVTATHVQSDVSGVSNEIGRL